MLSVFCEVQPISDISLQALALEHELTNRNKSKLGYFTYPTPASRDLHTIFSEEFLLAIVDEAHQARKHTSKVYQALRDLAFRTKFPVIVTATPIIQSVMDAFNMGRLGRHKEFDGEGNNQLIVDICASIRSAQHKRRQNQKGEGTARLARGLRNGLALQSAPGPLDTYQEALAKHGRDIGKRLGDCGIRRTIESVDNLGNPIIHLPRPNIRILAVPLYDVERKWHMDRYAVERERRAGGVSAKRNSVCDNCICPSRAKSANFVI